MTRIISFFFNFQDIARFHGYRRCKPQWLTGDAAFAEEITWVQQCDDGFLTRGRSYRNLYRTGLQVQN